MTGTALTPTKRFIRPGVTVVRFLTTAVDYKALTLAELNAGTDLQPEIADTSGWSVSSNLVETPDWSSRYTKKVAGMITADDSSLTFWADQDGQDVRTLLPRDTTGFIVWLDGGLSGGVMDVYPVTVASQSKTRTATDPAQIVIDFSIDEEPSENQAIPTV